ncbi:hypothetical protein Dda_2267 [Drechslerella dactyloides]|uniref:Glycosyltransferase family 62 protein n=1 Tax=Drechslerella dactyloides TaxID=74499 RepID=A0AAD6J373_DREDA|nr:hypothetical protein Dda_2267 [Drechslerella dactyloides]
MAMFLRSARSSFFSPLLFPFASRGSLRFFAVVFLVSFLLLAYVYPLSFSRFDQPTAPHVRWEPKQHPLYPHVRQMHDDPSLLRTVFRTEHDDYSRNSPHANLTLVLTITNDTSSWGRMTHGTPRKWQFIDYIDRIREQKLPPSSVHLGLLVSDRDAYAAYVDELASATDLPFARADVIYMSSLPGDAEPGKGISRKERHSKDKAFQCRRRRHIARVRNFLSNQVLTPAVKHVIWLDADVYELPKGLFERFVNLGSIPIERNISDIVKYVDLRDSKQIPNAPSTTATAASSTNTVTGTGTSAPKKSATASDSEKATQSTTSASAIAESTAFTPLPIGLLTLRCEANGWMDYDRNAWAGFGYRPTNRELNAIHEGRRFPGMRHWAKALSQLIQDTRDDQLVRLDAVGGTALYIRAELLREGLAFSVYSVSGTQWGHDGEDGVETEGLCFIAQRMGYACYTLGGQWRTMHSDA